MASSTRRPEPPPTSEPSREVNNLIVQLTELLDNRNEYERPIPTTEALSAKNNEDLIKIFATKIHSTNSANQDHFVYVTQFDVEEPETYARAMQCPNAPKWAKAMEEKLDQLKKNETWILTPKSEIQLGHQPLRRKWVYKIKRDVDGNIVRFKARWVVKGSL